LRKLNENEKIKKIANEKYERTPILFGNYSFPFNEGLSICILEWAQKIMF
jgi:hypothetical protein